MYFMYYHWLMYMCGTFYNYLINNSYILHSVTESIHNRYRFKENRMKILFVEVQWMTTKATLISKYLYFFKYNSCKYYLLKKKKKSLSEYFTSSEWCMISLFVNFSLHIEWAKGNRDTMISRYVLNLRVLFQLSKLFQNVEENKIENI